MNEGKLREDLERGSRAERLLTDPLIVEAFGLVESHIIGKFREAPIRDEEGVVKAKQLLHCLTLFRRAFEDAVSNGKLAANALDPKKRGAPFLGDMLKWKR
jgi:hypothetical protein